MSYAYNVKRGKRASRIRAKVNAEIIREVGLGEPGLHLPEYRKVRAIIRRERSAR